MIQVRRVFSASERRELFERWRKGESLSEIGRALDRHAATIHGALLRTGGFSPRRQLRSVRHLSLQERETISRGLAAGKSLRSIAKQVGRAPSTISRELQRHGGRQRYRAARADERAYKNACRPKPCLLARNRGLRDKVASLLQKDWSPQQIAGWLRLSYPSEPAMRVSHETIYKTLFVQTRGALKRELIAYLRTKRPTRQSRYYNTKGSYRGQIIDSISIHERPAEVEDRAVPGHWEGDLLAGSGNTHIATLVERSSRFTLLVKVDGKDTDSVVTALKKQIRTLPRQLKNH